MPEIFRGKTPAFAVESLHHRAAVQHGRFQKNGSKEPPAEEIRQRHGDSLTRKRKRGVAIASTAVVVLKKARQRDERQKVPVRFVDVNRRPGQRARRDAGFASRAACRGEQRGEREGDRGVVGKEVAGKIKGSVR